jgi:Tol biopolymer transport system component
MIATLTAVVITTILERSTGAESQSPALAARSASVAGAAGSKIVFTSFVQRPGTFATGPRFPDIYVMNVDGSGERRLARGAEAAWSPDGRSLAFTGELGDNLEVYAMSFDGSARRNLTRSPADDGGAVWSPDGRRIAFVRTLRAKRTPHEFGPGDIYVMNAGGSGQRRLTQSPASEWGAVWTPDGKKIAFVRSRGRSRTTDIFVMNADGSGKRRLARGTAPSWSSDGQTILFLRGRGSNTVPQIYVMNAGGSGQRRLAAGTAPAWSPDGQKIAFLRGSFPGELRVMNADGSGQRSLGWNSYDAPSWSPDGRRIAFATGAVASGPYQLVQRTGPDIYTINADGSGLRRLTHRPGWEGSPLWSPTG